MLNPDSTFCSTHRVGPKDLQAGFVGLQQLAHHFEKTLHKQVDALTVAGHEQLVQSLHGYAHVPRQEINQTSYQPGEDSQRLGAGTDVSWTLRGTTDINTEMSSQKTSH